MSPRRYSMSIRAEQAAQTRERIWMLRFCACYREAGISATSLQAIARRAHVSAATVLNHFGSADELTRIVIDRLAADLHIPDDSEWPPRGRTARVQRLVCEMFRVYSGAARGSTSFRAELDVDPALRKGEAGFWQAIGQLYGRVFSPGRSKTTGSGARSSASPHPAPSSRCAMRGCRSRMPHRSSPTTLTRPPRSDQRKPGAPGRTDRAETQELSRRSPEGGAVCHVRDLTDSGRSIARSCWIRGPVGRSCSGRTGPVSATYSPVNRHKTATG